MNLKNNGIKKFYNMTMPFFIKKIYFKPLANIFEIYYFSIEKIHGSQNKIFLSRPPMQNWEPKFSDTLGMIYNNFCHNLNFKSNSKLKNWSSDDVMVISNNETNVILDFEKGFYNHWISGFYQLRESEI